MKIIKSDNGKRIEAGKLACGDLFECNGELFMAVNVTEKPDLVLVVNMRGRHTETFSWDVVVTPMDATIAYKPLDAYAFYKRYGDADGEKDKEEAATYDPLSL